jgi:hypothetical protein
VIYVEVLAMSDSQALVLAGAILTSGGSIGLAIAGSSEAFNIIGERASATSFGFGLGALFTGMLLAPVITAWRNRD